MPKKSKKGQFTEDKITVVILEDHPVMASATKSELDKPEIIICAISNNVEDFLKELNTYKPTIAIIDLRIIYQEKDDYDAGFSAISSGKELSPSTKFIIYTVYDDLKGFEKGMNLGVKAFINKNIYEKPLDEIVKIVYEGGTYFGVLLDQYLGRLNEKAIKPDYEIRDRSTINILTRRELEVLKYLNESLSIKEIAAKMNVEQNTIKAHTQSIRKKFNVKTTKEAVRAYVISKASNSELPK